MPLPLSLVIPAMFILSAPSYAVEVDQTTKQMTAQKSAAALPSSAPKAVLSAQKKQTPAIRPIVASDADLAIERKRAAAKKALKLHEKAL